MASAWRSPGKIHTLEARATPYGLKKASAEIVTHGRIIFSVGDNLCSILAYEKGRARCEDLLAQCRQAAGYVIGAQIRWHHRHIESERNVTDHDSRAADRGEIHRGQAQSVYGSLASILGKFNARGRGALRHRAERPSVVAPAPAPPPSVTMGSPPLKQKSPGPPAIISATSPRLHICCCAHTTTVCLSPRPLVLSICDTPLANLVGIFLVPSAFAHGTSSRSSRAAVGCRARSSNVGSRSCARLTSRRAHGTT